MYHIVYFLEAINYPSRHYIGYTTNIKERIKEHNRGQVVSTKKFKPWKLIYAEIYLNKQDALGRERFLKSGSGWKFLRKQLQHYLNEKKHAHLSQTPPPKTPDPAVSEEFAD